MVCLNDIKYSTEFFSISFSGKNMKDAYLKACKWYATNVLSKDELHNSTYADTLYDMSSLLPTRYNADISKIRNDIDSNARHIAMAQNATMSTLIQLMDIGTPTNISQNK